MGLLHRIVTFLVGLFFTFLVFLSFAVAAQVKHVQIGTAVISATQQTIPITPVNDNKAILFFTLMVDRLSAGPQDTHLRGQLNCTFGLCDSIDFKRYGSNGNVILNWQVVEFKVNSMVNIQRGIETQFHMSDGIPARKIRETGVNVHKSFVLLSEFVHGGVSGDEAFTRAQLDASGNLVLTVGAKKNRISQAEIAWQVVEYHDAVVQSGDVIFSRTDSRKTVIVGEIDRQRSWLVYNYYHTAKRIDDKKNNLESLPICQSLVSGIIDNSKTLQFNRGCASNVGELHLSWFLIEFTDKTRIQQGNLWFDYDQHQQTALLKQTVNPHCAITTMGYHQRGGQSSATTDHVTSAWFHAILDTTGKKLHLSRGQTNKALAEVGWFVLEFEDCRVAMLKDYGDAPLSGIAPNGKNSNNYGVASHILVQGRYLGFADPDPEGDNNDILFMPTLSQGQKATFTMFASGQNGYLQVWIDFDGNGVFDNYEQVATNLQDNGTGEDAIANDGSIIFTINVPRGAITTPTYARFRWSKTLNLDSKTAANDGEVEDYQVTIQATHHLADK